MLDNKEPSALRITIFVSVGFILVGIPIYIFEGFGYLPAYIALFIGIASIIYTRENALMNIKIKHSDSLHEFLQFWIEQTNDLKVKIQRSIGGLIKLKIPYNSIDRDKLELEIITRNILYNDLVNNHIDNAHINLNKKWSNYINLLKRYRGTAEEMLTYISKKTNEMFGNKHISIENNDNFNYQGNNLVFPWFNEIIFLYFNNSGFKFPNPEYAKSNYVGENNSIEGYKITIRLDDITIPALGIVNDDLTAKEFIDVFNRLKSKDSEISKYIKILDSTMSQIESLFKWISSDINELLEYPVFGEKCSFIKKAL